MTDDTARRDKLREALEDLSRAADLLRPEPHMNGLTYHTTGPVSTQRAYEAIERAISALAAPAAEPRPSPYADAAEHARQSRNGTHLYDDHCAFCWFEAHGPAAAQPGPSEPGLRATLTAIEQVAAGPAHRLSMLRDWARNHAEELAALAAADSAPGESQPLSTFESSEPGPSEPGLRPIERDIRKKHAVVHQPAGVAGNAMSWCDNCYGPVVDALNRAVAIPTANPGNSKCGWCGRTFQK